MCADALNLDQKAYDLLRTYIQENCSISLGDDKKYLIESRFSPLVRELNCKNYIEFYLRIKSDKTGVMREKIIDAITTNETLWFRDNGPWVLLREKIIPFFLDLLKKKKKDKIRIWCAACSTGQEPYSLAILIDSLLNSYLNADIKPEHFDILGTDISTKALDQAKKAEYSSMEIARGLEDSLLKRYFTYSDLNWKLKESIIKRVRYARHNLQDSLGGLGTFDLIMCRNVIIYFDDNFKKDLVSKMRKQLSPDGLFILGASESLIRYSDEFVRSTYKGSIYYYLPNSIHAQNKASQLFSPAGTK